MAVEELHPSSDYSSALMDTSQTNADHTSANAYPKFKTLMCFFYKKNRCVNGADCRFAHGLAELKKNQATYLSNNNTNDTTISRRKQRGLSLPSSMSAASIPSALCAIPPPPPPPRSAAHSSGALSASAFSQNHRLIPPPPPPSSSSSNTSSISAPPTPLFPPSPPSVASPPLLSKQEEPKTTDDSPSALTAIASHATPPPPPPFLLPPQAPLPPLVSASAQQLIAQKQTASSSSCATATLSSGALPMYVNLCSLLPPHAASSNGLSGCSTSRTDAISPMLWSSSARCLLPSAACSQAIPNAALVAPMLCLSTDSASLANTSAVIPSSPCVTPTSASLGHLNTTSNLALLQSQYYNAAAAATPSDPYQLYCYYSNLSRLATTPASPLDFDCDVRDDGSAPNCYYGPNDVDDYDNKLEQGNHVSATAAELHQSDYTDMEGKKCLVDTTCRKSGSWARASVNADLSGEANAAGATWPATKNKEERASQDEDQKLCYFDASAVGERQSGGALQFKGDGLHHHNGTASETGLGTTAVRLCASAGTLAPSASAALLSGRVLDTTTATTAVATSDGEDEEEEEEEEKDLDDAGAGLSLQELQCNSADKGHALSASGTVTDDSSPTATSSSSTNKDLAIIRTKVLGLIAGRVEDTANFRLGYFPYVPAELRADAAARAAQFNYHAALTCLNQTTTARDLQVLTRPLIVSPLSDAFD